MNVEVKSELGQIWNLHVEYHMSTDYVEAVGFYTSECIECEVTKGSILGMPNVEGSDLRFKKK